MRRDFLGNVRVRCNDSDKPRWITFCNKSDPFLVDRFAIIYFDVVVLPIKLQVGLAGVKVW